MTVNAKYEITATRKTANDGRHAWSDVRRRDG